LFFTALSDAVLGGKGGAKSIDEGEEEKKKKHPPYSL